MIVSDVTTRPATSSDAQSINQIYNAYIVDSHVSFDTDPWSDEKRLDWLDAIVLGGFPVLVAEHDGDVLGAAWA